MEGVAKELLYRASLNCLYVYKKVSSLINMVTDDCDLYTIWSSETKVNTTLVASCLILEFDKLKA